MSRAKYFRERRKNMYTIYTMIEKDYGDKLEKILNEKKLLKTDWIREKIEEDYNKL